MNKPARFWGKALQNSIFFKFVDWVFWTLDFGVLIMLMVRYVNLSLIHIIYIN